MILFEENNSFLTSPPPQLLNQKNDLKKPKLEERSPSFKKQQYPNISEQKGKKNSIMTCGPNFQKPSNNTDKEKNFGVNFSNCDHSISINSCLICFENAPDSVFMDCGHGGMCYVCATDIFKKTGECYLCRNVIKQVLLLDLQDKNDNLFKVKAATRLVTPSEDIYGLKNSEKMYVS